MQSDLIRLVQRQVRVQPEIQGLRGVPFEPRAHADLVHVAETLVIEPVALPCPTLLRRHRQPADQSIGQGTR